MHIHLNNKPFIICLLYIVICNVAYAQKTYIYDARGKRDPFVPLVSTAYPSKEKPKEEKKRVIESLEDIMSVEDARFYLRLQGIAHDDSGKKVAILNGETVEEGETVGKLKVKKILKNEVTLIIEEQEYKLNIYEIEEGG
ncbi:MAG: hypothetical protein JSV93_06280 [Candidatus Omnitrophota bacterium]|nr:MAG: hypothetical protein JSV93_06280 [Candidatus Omnitrophota bacterium]